MPAERFTKKAKTSRLKRMWQHVYESAKARGASEGSAIRQANAAVRDAGKKNRRRKRGKMSNPAGKMTPRKRRKK